MEERSNPRSLVLDVLLSVEEGAFLDRALSGVLDGHPALPHRERAFIRRLCMGTIERQIELDYILDCFAEPKVKKMKPVIRAILRSGTYQLFYMDAVPDSAVINEAVRLASRRGLSGLSGFVNGVLRNVARSREKIVYPKVQEDPIRALSVRYSMPEWITEFFVSSYGIDRSESILAAYLKERPLVVRVDTRIKSPDEVKASLAAEGIRVKADERLPYAFSLEGFDALEEIPEFIDGTIYPQDVASMMVVETAAPGEGQCVLDLCAAPGGKSIHAAQAMRGTGQVLARDLTEEKVELIRENAKRCRVNNLRAEVWDACVFDPGMKEKVDLVLADLPCSGLGVIGHKPDIKYNASEEAVHELAQLQREILSTAVRYVRPGGTLLYSTCTVTEEENGENTRWLLSCCPDFSLDEQRQYLPDEGCDGFYLAKLKRE